MNKNILKISFFSILLFFFCFVCNAQKTEKNIFWEKKIKDIKNSSFINLKIFMNYLFITDEKKSIHAIDLEKGYDIWYKKVKSFLGKKESIFNSIEIGKNSIYLSSNSGKIYSIDIVNGEVLWNLEISDSIISDIFYYKGILFVQSANGILQAIDADYGRIIWSMKIRKKFFSIQEKPIFLILENKILINDDYGYLNAILIENGELVWKKKIFNFSDEKYLDVQENTISNMEKKKDVMFFSSYKNCFALENKSGSLLWELPIGTKKKCIFQENAIFLLNNKNKIIGIDSSNGKILWKNLTFLNQKTTNLQIKNREIILGDSKGYLYKINANNGKVVSKKRVCKSSFFDNIIVQKERVILVSKKGKIYSFR
ncbi:PQQ-binding-like beta-propeller repeat protein [bacterium endosymbiont of Pedicinus badii]|uniref:outer membrane protein assembly factor BamB family protein n=1 Tax=bacterium endosymbiont of Pedicinus badii TaxID=1719126 RepID=UPI0009BAEDE6|nr:PQQ-binding-like beta-propeller repeat protein [bacterium endosymbiont of Pedicinus badii]OQM34484.1 hypothetical protein AOQ89_01180 [bacterium endosymbiont of Pedicinus badii]